MALAKAVALGAIASLATPFVLRRAPGETPHWLSHGALHLEAGGVHLYWSWPIFCMVTLAAWILFKSAGTR